MTVRVDGKIKSDAQKTFAKLGLDLSSAVKLFLHQSVMEQGLPFQPRTINGFTQAYENTLIKETKKLSRDIKSGKSKGYTSINKLHADLMK
jgi:DNA-damage-inducible protein J